VDSMAPPPVPDRPRPDRQPPWPARRRAPTGGAERAGTPSPVRPPRRRPPRHARTETVTNLKPAQTAGSRSRTHSPPGYGRPPGLAGRGR